LNALAAAKNGVYCGPLRLLAWEVQGTLLNRGVQCSLVTGQERDSPENSTHISCTVEMADLSTEFEVAVIDEAQLFGDESRGWAWTQAFLGLKAKVSHIYRNFFLVIKFLSKSTNLNEYIQSEYHYCHVHMNKFNNISLICTGNSSLWEYIYVTYC
jgi:hypothetical protein